MKAFASDFDGTLYLHTEPKGMKAADLEAIQRFQAAGNAFGVCTGRSLQGILLALPEPPGFDFFILSSGALVVDREYRPILKRCIDRKLMEEIYARYEGKARIVIQANDTVYTITAPRYPMQTQIDSLDEIPGEDIYGFSFGLDTAARAAAIAASLNARYEGRISAFQNVTNVDIVAANCSKGSGMRFVKEYFGAALTGSIGDSFNDIPMLEASDRAFTFPFAPEAVQAVADSIVNSVAEALEQM